MDHDSQLKAAAQRMRIAYGIYDQASWFVYLRLADRVTRPVSAKHFNQIRERLRLSGWQSNYGPGSFRGGQTNLKRVWELAVAQAAEDSDEPG